MSTYIVEIVKLPFLSATATTAAAAHCPARGRRGAAPEATTTRVRGVVVVAIGAEALGEVRQVALGRGAHGVEGLEDAHVGLGLRVARRGLVAVAGAAVAGHRAARATSREVVAQQVAGLGSEQLVL